MDKLTNKNEISQDNANQTKTKPKKKTDLYQRTKRFQNSIIRMIDNYCLLFNNYDQSILHQDILAMLIYLPEQNPYYYSEHGKLYYISYQPSNIAATSYFNIIHLLSVKELFSINNLPYTDSAYADLIYIEVCRLVRYNNIKKHKEAISSSDASNYSDSEFIYYLMKYLLDCNISDSEYPYKVPVFLSAKYNYFLFNKTLYFNTEPPIPVSKISIVDIFRKNNVPLPIHAYSIRNLFNYIQKNCNICYTIPELLNNNYEIIYKDIDDSCYCYSYALKHSNITRISLHELITETKVLPKIVYTNTKYIPQLSNELKDYLNKLCMNDFNTLRTLAMITAGVYSNQHPQRKTYLFEFTDISHKNLIHFWYDILKISITNALPNELISTSKLYKFYTKTEKNYTYLDHVIIGRHKNISKCNHSSSMLLKKIINGTTISLKDPYITTFHYRNSAPILNAVSSFNDNDATYFHKNFDCLELQINSTELLTLNISYNDISWLQRVFIPWGMDMLSNKKLDITKNIKLSKEIEDCNPIQKFIEIGLIIKQRNPIYPDDVYKAYLDFLKVYSPNTQPVTKGAFIKQIRKNNDIDYRQYHIRKTSTHEGSNKYAFHNIAINSEALQSYTTEDVMSEEQKKQDIFMQALEMITENYIHLFDGYNIESDYPIVYPNTSTDITLNNKENSENNYSIQKVDYTI